MKLGLAVWGQAIQSRCGEYVTRRGAVVGPRIMSTGGSPLSRPEYWKALGKDLGLVVDSGVLGIRAL